MKSFVLLFMLSCASSLFAAQSDIENLYITNGINGSILIESVDGKKSYQYNVKDKEAFVPASTFKIPNTLIILEEGLITDLAEVIKWDGVDRAFASWNQDQNLKTAFQRSCVWCYQRYAKKVGDKKYHDYLQKFDYGNQMTGDDITRFWLDGDLRVSVQDQIVFLRKLYEEDLPVKKQHIRTLKEIMLTEDQDQLKVWSKTGWSGKDGWYVGYLTINDQTWLFANHIQVKQKSDLDLRKKLTMDAFKAVGIIH